MKKIICCFLVLLCGGCSFAESKNSAPPVLRMADCLSSSGREETVETRDYYWSYRAEKTDHEISGYITDSPVQEIVIPPYDPRLTSFDYAFLLHPAPDELRLLRTSAENEDWETVEKNIGMDADGRGHIVLEPGWIYKLEAEWKRSNYRKKGYYGDASYIFSVQQYRD